MDFFNFLKNNKFIVLTASIIINIILGVTSIFLVYKNTNYECVCKEEKKFSGNITESECEKSPFYVEIKGAVKKPGVYEATDKNIINDIVKLAGGFTKKAYTKNINLSRRVTNELVIYVFTESEYKKNNTKVITKVIEEKCECSGYVIDNCIENKVSEIISSDKDTVFENKIDDEIEEKNNLVNINTATKNELMSLSGIGESKAEDIINYRNSSGSFKNIEEIKNVSGIGDALFAKIKENITV